MKIEKIRAVCFDLGETLICYEGTPLNWKEHYHNALQEVSSAFGEWLGKEAKGRAIETLLQFNTRENPRLEEVNHETIFRKIGIHLGIQAHSPTDICRPFFRYFQRRAKPFPNTITVLKELRNKHIATGVLTDVPYGMPKEFVLEDLQDLTPYLNTVVTSVEAGYRKPHRAGFQLLAETLSIPISGLVYVGNEKKDIDGGLSAGAVVVLIDRDRQHPDWKQDYTIDTMLELNGILA